MDQSWVVSRILSIAYDPFRDSRLELVCKQWRGLIRNHPRWRVEMTRKKSKPQEEAVAWKDAWNKHHALMRFISNNRAQKELWKSGMPSRRASIPFVVDSATKATPISWESASGEFGRWSPLSVESKSFLSGRSVQSNKQVCLVVDRVASLTRPQWLRAELIELGTGRSLGSSLWRDVLPSCVLMETCVLVLEPSPAGGGKARGFISKIAQFPQPCTSFDLRTGQDVSPCRLYWAQSAALIRSRTDDLTESVPDWYCWGEKLFVTTSPCRRYLVACAHNNQVLIHDLLTTKTTAVSAPPRTEMLWGVSWREFSPPHILAVKLPDHHVNELSRLKDG